jgi:hypothetical protein
MATQVGHHTREGERRIRFISNVAYDGTDYGPDYDEAEVSLPPNFAHQFVSEGRAIYIDEGPTEAVHEETKAKAEADAKSRRR